MGGTAELFDARHDGAFGWRVARALHIGGVGKKSEDTFAAIAGECSDVKAFAIDWSVVDFEVAGVNDDSDWSANGERDAIDRAMRDRDEFDFVRANLDAAAGNHLAERCGF